MDSASGKPFEEGKREAEDATEIEVASAKKQRVEEKLSEIKTDAIEDKEKVEADTSCSKSEQLLKVKVSSKDGLLVSVLKEKCNVSEENTVAAEKKPAVTAEGYLAAASKKDESNNDSDSCFQDETSLGQNVAGTIRALSPLIDEDPAALSRRKDESNMDSKCCSKDETILGGDVTVAKLSSPALSVPISLVSVPKKDDSWTNEFVFVHNTDDSVATANKAPAAFTERGPVLASEKKDESGSDNEIFDEVAAESIPLVFKEEDKNNDELELDNETSSSDDDAQTPATPTEQTTGGKTLFVGNLSFSVEQEDVENFFKAAGEVVNIRFGMNSDETFKGYGYVEFASAEAAEKALHELNGKELLRRRVRLDFAKERRPFTPYSGCPYTDSIQKEGKSLGHTVFIRGFNKADCQDEIRRYLEEHFGSCGEISRVSVPKDQDGCARGIAYIDFKDREAFTRALAFNGSEFREGMLSVKEAMSRFYSRDIAGNGRGYGRNGDRNSWRDSSGRTGWRDSGGRRDWRDFPGRSVRVAGGGRSGWRDLSGRRSDYGNVSGRRGVHEAGGGRGDWRDVSGRGGWQDMNGRRGGWQHMSGRRGVDETGNWWGRGGWQDSSRRGGGTRKYFNGRPGYLGTGVWLGGGGWGQVTPTRPYFAAPVDGNNISLYNEDQVEYQMK